MVTPALDAFLTERLNSAQKDAVVAPDGPLLILAGAGSGKTRVISYRIAYLVEELKVAPEAILGVTFTNKAAGEMKERAAGLIGPRAKVVTLGTFHSICARWLRRYISRIRYEASFTIYDDDDQLSLLKRLYPDAGLNPKQFTPQAVRSEISRAKEKLYTPADYSRTAESPLEYAAASLYRRYQDGLQEANAVDFDDLLVLTLRLFDEAPDILQRLQRQYQHVLVDEYQDVNKAQYLLVKQLAAEHRNLTIVGDDSQAIYGWRGANVKYILEFEHDFPDCRVVRLEQNYRSTKTILGAARAIEAGLGQRHRKELWTENDKGHPITVCRARDERDEAAFIAREIERLHADGYKFGDFAVMYRMNSFSRAIEEAFIRRRLNYQIVGGPRFYERREVKDVVAYLRLIHNRADTVSLERVINVPGRGIGETTLDQLREWASALGVPVPHALAMLQAAEGDSAPTLGVPPPFTDRAARQLIGFQSLMIDFRAAAESEGLVELFDRVIRRTSYDDFIRAEKGGEDRLQNVLELRTVVSDYAGMDAGTGLRAFLENVSLFAGADAMKDSKETVTLLTLHSAKGLEFPVVFIPGMEDGILPHSRAQGNADEMDEERRLCYVGMTRAMRLLYLIHCETRTVFGTPRPAGPSPFLASLPEDSLRFVDSYGMAANPLGGGPTAVRSWSGTATRVASDQRKSFGPLVRPGTEIPSPVRRAYPGAATLPPVRSHAPPPVAPPVSAVVKYSQGDRVRHASFGEGTVVESTLTRRGEEEVKVTFDEKGMKVLLGALAPMEILARAT